jgi:hypothetical protein
MSGQQSSLRKTSHLNRRDAGMFTIVWSICPADQVWGIHFCITVVMAIALP